MSGGERIGYDDLLRHFYEGCKPESDLRVGGEYELFGVDSSSGTAVPYDGEEGIGRILDAMLVDPKWSAACEQDQLLCLVGRDRSNVTLEPGAQVELSGAPMGSLSGMGEELRGFVGELSHACRGMKVDFIGIGMHPVSTGGSIPFLRKCRYDVMAPYLEKKGALAHTMMKETATVQVNLDYTDEEDALDKLRTAMGVTSLVSAMLANSPLSGGKPNGFLTRREHVWLHTDPDRCGLLPFVFRREAGFEDYLRYALQVPMIFVFRDDVCVPMEGIPFREFLEKGAYGLKATLDDWELHLSTLFPEIRLKQYIELRGADAQGPGLALAVPSLWKGILYDREARTAAWELVSGWSLEERFLLHREVCRKGLQARIRGRSILGPARDLIRIARQGLENQKETLRFLEPLEDLVIGEGRCPAQVLLEKWEGWNHDAGKLIADCSYLRFRGGAPSFRDVSGR